MRTEPNRDQGRACWGFTLVELLVVIAIVAVLAGILLPVLGKAKGQARRVQCLGAQRQLFLASALYSGDNGEVLAPNGHGDPEDPATPRTWVAGDSHFYIPSYTNTQYLVDARYAAFAPYLPTAAVYKCPEDHAVLNRSGVKSVPQIRSYAMNSYLGWSSDITELTAGYKVFRSAADFGAGAPSRLFMFTETHPNSICMPGFITYMPGGEVDGFYHYPSSLHGGAGIVTFTDGHVETHGWEDARTRKRVTTGVLAHWDASPGNVDVRWLQERATRSLAIDVVDAGSGDGRTSAGITGGP